MNSPVRKVVLSVLLLLFVLPVSVRGENAGAKIEEKTDSESARKPVKVEELLTSKRKWILDTVLLYSNINRYSIINEQNAGLLGLGLLGPNQSTQKVQEVNEDFISGLLKIRHGVAKDLELFAFGSYFFDFQRISLDGQLESRSADGFNSAGVGATYQVRGEDRYPALLISATANIAENTGFAGDYRINYLKTFSASLVSYYTVDPVVFFLQTTYQENLKRKVGGNTIDPGEVLVVSPQIFFVVNPFVTFSGGFKWTLQSGDKVNSENVPSTSTDILSSITAPMLGVGSKDTGQGVSSARSGISYLLGFAYGIRDNLTLFLDTEFRSKANFDQTTVSLRLTYIF